MGARHAQNLHQLVAGARVAAVYDLDHDRAAQVAATCGEAQVFRDPVELIQSPAVDAVLVVSPDPTHAAFTHECLRQGKPVLCEKPLATTPDDAMALVEAELALGRRLIAVGYMRRFDPRHLAVARAVASGALGRPILFKGVHRNPMTSPTATGATVLTNSASHDLDAARWLLGQEVTRVFVQGVRTHGAFSPATVDMLLIQLTLSGDCMAAIECSVAVEYGYEVLAEVVGERGAALTLPLGDAVVRAGGVRTVAVTSSHLDCFQAAFVPELTAWVASVNGQTAFPGASAWDGYLASLVADACSSSLAGGMPVAVPTPARPALYNGGG